MHPPAPRQASRADTAGRQPRSPWHARAVAASRLRQSAAASLRRRFADALHALTGRAVAPAAIFVDQQGRATTRLDGALFRWQDGRAHLICTCAHCGTGAFTSPPLDSAAALGLALLVWRPLHDDCQPFDPDDFD